MRARESGARAWHGVHEKIMVGPDKPAIMYVYVSAYA